MTLPLVLRRKFHIIPVLVFQKPVPRGNGLELLPLEFHVNVILEHAFLEHVTPAASRNLAFVEIIAEQHAVTFQYSRPRIWAANFDVIGWWKLKMSNLVPQMFRRCAHEVRFFLILS